MSVRVCYAQLLVFILFLYSPLGELNSELTLDVFFPRLCLCERVSLTCTAVTSVNSTLKNEIMPPPPSGERVLKYCGEFSAAVQLAGAFMFQALVRSRETLFKSKTLRPG